MSSTDNSLKSVKYVIAGLDNAGKTSFLIALRKKYNFYDKVLDLKPTIRIEYSSFNILNRYEVRFWDMGGQEKYRKMYLGKPIYFEGTDVLYYFIDILDEKKIAHSIEYLKELLEIYDSMNYQGEIIVCLNKFDPNLRSSNRVNARVEKVKRELNNLTPFNKKIFKTSIFDLSSLSKAISQSLAKLIDINSIESCLESYMNELDGIYAVIYSDSGVIIADNVRDVIDFQTYERSIRRKINEDLILIQKLSESNVKFSEQYSSFKNTIEFLKKLDVAGNSIYLKVFIPNIEKSEIFNQTDRLYNSLVDVFAKI